MVLSADPVANHSLPGSTATDLTHLNSVSEAWRTLHAGVNRDVVLHDGISHMYRWTLCSMSVPCEAIMVCECPAQLGAAAPSSQSRGE